MNNHKNPLIEPFDLAPFSEIENKHFLPAFKALIAKTKVAIDAVANNTSAASFENTIEVLEYSGAQLDRVSSVFFNLNAAETNEEIQKIAQEVSPLLSEFNNDITLNKALFDRIKTVYEQHHSATLSAEQKTLLEKKYKSFSRNGANLDGERKEKLRTIDKQLASLKLKFGEHLLAETNSFELHLTEEKDLEGLPKGVCEAALQTARQKGKTGWIFTLDYPSYIPFMKYASNRALRKKLALANGAKGFQNNQNNNEAIVLEIANLRQERAALLGYATHAHFILEERMAGSPENVTNFLNELLEKAKPVALKEFKELEDFAKALDAIDGLEKWDGAYYSEKLKRKLFDLDDEKLKPFFKLENVIQGAFAVAKKLFGLEFKTVHTVDTYHEDVKTYEVFNDSGAFVAYFYADFHPRPGKRNGAWMTSFKGQKIINGNNERPHISNVCNFTKPTATKPALLTFNEVSTLFHEFGHGLHGMLANTTYPSLSGTSVFWDFVELPSQLLENWCFEKECLDLFAKHYETGALIPMEYVEKIKASANFQEGMATLRQISFGLLDMSWHGADPKKITSVKDQELNAFSTTALYPDVRENCMSTAFAHIFQGGYSSGYYSYKWAEVLDADAFELFNEEGIFNSETGRSFANHILSKGGTEHPMVLYKRFRGRTPKPEALLKRAGLLN
jgi:peptidyl-dipeptidase Dcp